LAAQPIADDLRAVILVAPNFAVADRRAWLLKWSAGIWLLKWWYESDYREFKPTNELHAQYWTERYPVEAISNMLQLMSNVEKIDKTTLDVPLLVFYSEGDTVVDVDAIKRAYKIWGSDRKQLIEIDNAEDPDQHVILGDILSPGSTEGSVKVATEFLKSIE
jgi:alpha-beta hydrolase superfamily lysophospholipase